ncbi:MAG: inositol-3-phosphate synthase, partial [Ekhidna sp.]
MSDKATIQKPNGKLGILTPGMGAVATTFMAGVLSVRKGLSEPIGSLTQMGTIRLGKRTEKRNPLIKDFVPLASLKDVALGGWDVFEDNAYEAAMHAKVLDKDLLNDLKGELEQIKPMKAVFDKNYVKRLNGTYVKTGANKMELAEMLMEDIKNFKKENNCERVVMVWCGSTEIYIEEGEVHSTIEKFEEGLRNNHPDIPPSMIYAYAAIKMGVPYANGAPN